jgi:hypothetical protein
MMSATRKSQRVCIRFPHRRAFYLSTPLGLSSLVHHLNNHKRLQYCLLPNSQHNRAHPIATRPIPFKSTSPTTRHPQPRYLAIRALPIATRTKPPTNRYHEHQNPYHIRSRHHRQAQRRAAPRSKNRSHAMGNAPREVEALVGRCCQTHCQESCSRHIRGRQQGSPYLLRSRQPAHAEAQITQRCRARYGMLKSEGSPKGRVANAIVELGRLSAALHVSKGIRCRSQE